ncbi:MAG: hypothetical protein FJW36_00970 [Acidobacteria bacterium]|nr:hypothetical protein [Acidobacteriota bacterium]
MIRALIGLLIAAIAAAFIRAVIGMITKEVTQMVNPDAAGGQAKPGPAGPGGPAGAAGPTPTALKKCPVCGTYVPAAQLIGGRFCSEVCSTKAS